MITAVEVSLDIFTPATSHFATPIRIPREVADRISQRSRITRPHEYPAFGALDHITNDTVDSEHDWPTGSEVVEHFVRVGHAKHRDVQ